MIMLIYFEFAVVLLVQSEIKLVTHCYIRLLYLRIIHLILQAASGPGIICDSKWPLLPRCCTFLGEKQYRLSVY